METNASSSSANAVFVGEAQDSLPVWTQNTSPDHLTTSGRPPAPSRRAQASQSLARHLFQQQDRLQHVRLVRFHDAPVGHHLFQYKMRL